MAAKLYTQNKLVRETFPKLIFVLSTLLTFLVFLVPSLASASTLPDIFDPYEIAFTEVASHPNASHTLALDQGGRLWAWGNNSSGQLGLGDTANRDKPTLVPLADLSGVSSLDTVIAGSSHTLALDQQGRLWAWGHNGSGQLGLGDTTHRYRPTLVLLADLSGVNSFEAVIAGGNFTLALDQQGKLWAWGNNAFGQLGLGDTTNRDRPTLVPLVDLSGVSSFDAVIAGNNYTLAFDQQGRLWAWGLNSDGRLGLGDVTERHVPTLVPLADLSGVNSFEAVIAGASHTLALDQQGRLWAWGFNGSGQLGLGDTVNRDRPTLVPLADLSGASSFDVVAAGNNHTLAFDQQGRLWAWGHNTSGQLGLGDATLRNIPTLVPITGLDGVISFDAVIAGNNYTLALDQQGRLWAWGHNAFGQLGLGDSAGRSTPMIVTHIGYLVETPDGTPIDGNVPLIKELIASEDVDLPDEMTFSFVLTPVVYQVDGIDSLPHDLDATFELTLNEYSYVDVNDGVATVSGYINLWNIIRSLNLGTSSGVFVWNLSEEPGSSGVTGMNYDSSRFQVRAWVDSGMLVYMLVHNLTVVDGEDAVGSKVDLGPVFTNMFGTEGNLEISKIITGVFADQSLEFTFTLTLAEGSLAPIPAGLIGQIYNHDNLPIPAPEGVIDITMGTNAFTLRHGYRIFIEGLPAGTTFTVHEAATPRFQPQAVTTVPGVGAFTVNANMGNSLTTASHSIVSTDDPTTVAFTNFYSWVPPTGLTIAGVSALPFILVTFLVIALLANRHRRAIEELPLA